jgi:uncharacterized protein YcaQ
LNADSISARDARRIALAAQGFGGRRTAAPGRRHLLGIVARLGAVQIDSVNVLSRAHYLPFLSRLGLYDRDLLDRLAWGKRPRTVFEYWAHEACLLPVELHTLFRWRMARAAAGVGTWAGIARFARERPDYIAAALAEIRDRGPLAASDLSAAGRSGGSWWGWSDGKRAVEYLFWAGLLTTSGRRGSFERVYDLPERVLPSAVLNAPTPVEADARRELLRIAAGALGIATEGDLKRYFRLSGDDIPTLVNELVDAGDLVPVRIEGWTAPAYRARDAAVRRMVRAATLLSPFDPLVWERDRAERLFGFRYRIEIYTPAHKRQHGYYVLPVLSGDRFVARVDLKADRAMRRLLVQAAHAEAGVDHADLAGALIQELGSVAGWLGLAGIMVANRGDLAPALQSRC